MKQLLLILIGLASTGLIAVGQPSLPTVLSPARVAVTQPLRDMHERDEKNQEVHYHQPLPKKDKGDRNDGPDLTLQSSPGTLNNANPGVRFPGIGAHGSAPSDANMGVGPNHIFQAVNSNYSVYDKSGALLLGPNSLSSLWAPLGTGCAIDNGGDVVVQYDKLADRWVITQLGGNSAPYSECIAISQTADPTGQYFLYSYSYGTTFNDYPKFGVWPTTTNSAYLATYNLFTNNVTFFGGQLCAYDRVKLLAGNAGAQAICYTINNDGGFLPSDLDGSAPPVDGTPGYFLTYETLSSLRMYALSPNFANPSASTLTQVAPDLAVAPFSEACPTGTCIPQSGTAQQLDSLGDRLMYRLAFRNFGDHEAMVVNHSVATGASVGVRWYELRSPVSKSGTFSLYQQGTYAPDASFRWMGSIAMDKFGDIGLGYSVSSSSLHPAIRYTGRTPGDSVGTMEAESSIIEGSGSQLATLSRWGDYTAMRIDPADDCTFWYTNQYLQSNGTFNWSTAFGSFKFSSCTATKGPPTGTAAFLKTDTTTAGSWKGVYGADGYNVINDTAAYPAYVSATPTGNSSYTFAASTSDPRGLLKASSNTDRIAACWYSSSAFSIDLRFNDSNTHQMALYLLDWDAYGNGRSERVDILDGNNTVLDSRTVSNFTTGQYLVWNLSGHVVVRVTNLNGSSNGLMNGLFFGTGAATPPPSTGTAAFLKTDTTTAGSWKGIYGADGYNVINDTAAYPAYVSATPTGNSSYTWAASTTDLRGLLKASSSTDRIAACWFSSGAFSIDLGFTDSNTHQVALYLLDWDNYFGRSERVDILDGNNTVLDSRTVSNFTGGQYLVWNLSGHIIVRITNTNAASNAVLSGILFR